MTEPGRSSKLEVLLCPLEEASLENGHCWDEPPGMESRSRTLPDRLAALFGPHTHSTAVRQVSRSLGIPPVKEHAASSHCKPTKPRCCIQLEIGSRSATHNSSVKLYP